MKFTKILTFAALALGFAVVLTDPAVAQLQSNFANNTNTADEFFTAGTSLMNNTLAGTERIVYGLGGLGAIALGTLAFFGRFQWAWFFGLVGGLVLIAAINYGISFITGQDIDSIVNDGPTLNGGGTGAGN